LTFNALWNWFGFKFTRVSAKISRLRFRVRVNDVSMPEKELKTPKGVAHLEQIPKARP